MNIELIKKWINEPFTVIPLELGNALEAEALKWANANKTHLERKKEILTQQLLEIDAKIKEIP